MSNNLNVGDLAIVIPDKGPNNVRNKPNGTVKGQIPEHAVLAILPARPAGPAPIPTLTTFMSGGTCVAGQTRSWRLITSR